MNASTKMKYSKPKRYLVRKLRKNERRMTTKKAKKAFGTVALAIAFMLTANTFIAWANSSKTITIENRHWDARENLENVADKSAMSTGEDGAVVPKEETELVEAKSPSEVVRMIEETFPEEKEIAVAVVKSESGLDPKRHSGTDRMADGRAFSIGLMQINLTVHKVGGKDCYKAFSGRDYAARVVDEDLYQECVKLAEDPHVNIATGRGIYERSGDNFGKWGGFTNNSYMKHL